MKIALVHDYLNQLGGAERVLEAFHEIFPQAPAYVIVHRPEAVLNKFANWDIRTTWLQRLPGSKKFIRFYLPLLPAAVESIDLSDYDIVLSSASAFAKGIITRNSAVHICYCHTPTRYLWSDTHRYAKDFASGITKPFLHIMLSRLRTWDRVAALRVEHFIANSNAVRERIKKYYGRTSRVIYPPVDTDKFYISDKIGDYYIMVTRLLPYKEVDTAICAFNKLGLKLKIVGVGRDLQKLRRRAKSNIEFLGYVSEERKSELLSKAIAFIHPQEEDFGIAAVEAMASGRPVIAYGKGGALETVIPDLSGMLYDEQTWESLAFTVIEFHNFRIKDFDPFQIKQHAEKFSKKRFNAEMLRVVREIYESRS